MCVRRSRERVEIAADGCVLNLFCWFHSFMTHILKLFSANNRVALRSQIILQSAILASPLLHHHLHYVCTTICFIIPTSFMSICLRITASVSALTLHCHLPHHNCTTICLIYHSTTICIIPSDSFVASCRIY